MAFSQTCSKISLLWLNKNVFNSSKVKLWREMASKMMACIKSWYPCTLERSIELKRVSMFLPEKGSVEWNSSKSLLHFIIHIRCSMQEFKKGGRFFVQLIKNLFVQSIEIVIQLVKGKLCISQGFNEQSANKLFVGGKVSGSSFFNNVSILVHGVVVISFFQVFENSFESCHNSKPLVVSHHWWWVNNNTCLYWQFTLHWLVHPNVFSLGLS